MSDFPFDVWVKVILGRKSRPAVTVEGSDVEAWASVPLRVRVAFFADDESLADITRIQQVAAQIKAANRSGAALAATDLSSDVNTALTLGEWKNRTAHHCAFYFTAEQMNLTVADGETATSYFLAFYGTALDQNDTSQPDTFGWSSLKVYNDGIDLESSIVGGSFRYNAGLPQSKFPDGTWHAWVPVFDQGQYLLDVNQAAASDIADLDSSQTRFSNGYMELLFPDATWHQITPVFDQGQYLVDVTQAEAGAFTQDTSKVRSKLGHVEFEFPDATWHRITPIYDQGQYLLDAEQTPSI